MKNEQAVKAAFEYAAEPLCRHRRRRERSVEKNAGNIFVAALLADRRMFSGFENPDGELTGGIQATGKLSR